MREQWHPRGIDVMRPSPARVYEYLLGGKDHFAADRTAAEEIKRALPEAPMLARANRAFAGRAIRFVAGMGMRQFIDLGAGLPSQGHVHEVARKLLPHARLVYVDHDPMVCAHGRAVLSGAPDAMVVQADIRDTERVLEAAAQIIDFDEPVAVSLLAVLHFLPAGGDPPRVIQRLRQVLAPGSHLIISHGSRSTRRDTRRRVSQVLADSNITAVSRTPAEIRRLFDGFVLISPGLVDTRLWRPTCPVVPHVEDARILAGVGRRP